VTMIDTIITALVSGAVTGLVTVISIKKDVEWLKERLREIVAVYEERITFLERNI
jgi:hypothetical protein